MIPQCIDMGVGIIPWSPLARGFLSGNRTRDRQAVTARAGADPMADNMYYADADFDIVDRVIKIAGNYGVKPAQIALAWMLHKPGITSPIVGASKLNHLEEAIAAVNITLSDDDIAALEEPYMPKAIAGHR